MFDLKTDSGFRTEGRFSFYRRDNGDLELEATLHGETYRRTLHLKEAGVVIPTIGYLGILGKWLYALEPSDKVSTQVDG